LDWWKVTLPSEEIFLVFLEIFPRKDEYFFPSLPAFFGKSRLTRITERRRGKSFYFGWDRGCPARGELWTFLLVMMNSTSRKFETIVPRTFPHPGLDIATTRDSDRAKDHLRPFSPLNTVTQYFLRINENVW